MAFKLTAEIHARLNTNSVASEIGKLQAALRQKSNGVSVPIKISVSGTKTGTINNIYKAFDNLNKILPATARNVDEVSRAFTGLKAAMSGQINVSKQLKAANQQAANSTKKVGEEAEKAETAMFKFGRISGLALRRAAGYTIAATALYGIGRAFAGSLRSAIDFQNEMVKVSQITGQSVASLRSLKEEVFKLSTGLGVSSKELLNAAQIIAQAGFSANDTRRALETLAKTSLAATFGDIEENTEGLIAVMAQFGIRAKDIERAFDAINEVSAQFAVESDDIIAAVKRTGGVFASLSKGVSEGQDALNEFIAIFSAVRSTTRESAETIATGLRTIFTRIQRPATVQLLKTFGIQLQDTQGKFIGLFNATNELAKGLERLDSRDLRFSQIVEELGGFRQIGKVLPLLQSFELRQKALQVAQESQNSLTEDAVKAQESYQVSLTKVREQFNKLVNDLTETGTFKAIISTILQLAETFIYMADAIKPLIPLIAGLSTFKLLKGLGGQQGFLAGAFRGVTDKHARYGGYVDHLNTGGQPKKLKGHIKQGSVNEDNVLAYIGRDEYVLPSETVRRVGVDYLDQLRRNEIPGFANGSNANSPKFRAGDIPGLTRDTLAKTLDKIADSGIELNKQFAKAGEKVGSFDKVLRDVVHRITQNRPKIASVGQLEQFSQRDIKAPSNIDKAIFTHLPKDLKVISEAANGIVTTKSKQFGIQKTPSNLVFSTDREQNIQNILNAGGRNPGAGRIRIQVEAKDNFLDRGVRSRFKGGDRASLGIGDIGFTSGPDLIDQTRQRQLQARQRSLEAAKQQRIKRRIFNDIVNNQVLGRGNDARGLTINDPEFEEIMRGKGSGITRSTFIPPDDNNPFSFGNSNRTSRQQLSSLGSSARRGYQKALVARHRLNKSLNKGNRRLGIGIGGTFAGGFVEQNTDSVAGSGVAGALQGGAVAASLGAGPFGIAGAATFAAITTAMAKRTEEVMESAAKNLEAGFDALNQAIENGKPEDIKKSFKEATDAIINQFNAQEFEKQNTISNQSLRFITGQGLAQFGGPITKERQGTDKRGRNKIGVFGSKFTSSAFLPGQLFRNPDNAISSDFVKQDTNRISRENVERGQQLGNAFVDQRDALLKEFTDVFSGRNIEAVLGNTTRTIQNGGGTEGQLSADQIIALASQVANRREKESLGAAAASGNKEQLEITARDIVRNSAQGGLLAQEEKQISAQDKLAAAMQVATAGVDRFAENMESLVALMERAGTVGDSFRKSNESLTTGFFSQQDNRNVFGNTKAFSLDEVAAEAGKIKSVLGKEFVTVVDAIEREVNPYTGQETGRSVNRRQTIRGNTADEFSNAIIGVKELQANLPSVIQNLNNQLKNINDDPKASSESLIASEIGQFKNLPQSLRDQITTSLQAEIGKRGKAQTLDNVDVNQLLDPIAEGVNRAAKAFVDANNRNIAEYEASIKEWVSIQQNANQAADNVAQARISTSNAIKQIQGRELSVADQSRGFIEGTNTLAQRSGASSSDPFDLGARVDRIGFLRNQLQAASQGDANARRFVGGQGVNPDDQGAVVRALGELKIQEDAAMQALDTIATNTDVMTALQNEAVKLQRAADAERAAAANSAGKSVLGQLKDASNAALAEQALKDPSLARSLGAAGGQRFQDFQAGLETLKAENAEDPAFLEKVRQAEAQAVGSSVFGSFRASAKGQTRQEYIAELANNGSARRDIERRAAEVGDRQVFANSERARLAQGRANQFGQNAQGRFEAERAAISDPSATIQNFISNLSTVATQLEKVNIPESINMKVEDVQMNIHITGAEQLQAMEGKLASIIESKIKGELSRYIDPGDGSLNPAPFAKGKARTK